MNEILLELKELLTLIYNHIDIINTIFLIFIFLFILKYIFKDKTTLDNLNKTYSKHEDLVQSYINIIEDRLKNYTNQMGVDINKLQSETLQAINDNVGLIGEIYKNSVVKYQNENIGRINLEITKPLEDIIEKIDRVNIHFSKNYKTINELRHTNNTLAQTINRRDKKIAKQDIENIRLKEEIDILKDNQGRINGKYQ